MPTYVPYFFVILQNKNKHISIIIFSMKYINAIIQSFELKEFEKDILINDLGKIGFESFETKPKEIHAYCQDTLFDESRLITVLKTFKPRLSLAYSIENVPDVNWNETWERTENHAIEINNDIVVYPTNETISKKYKYEILINPQQSFGTGHHETTRMMLENMLQFDFKNKQILDMGCGTGILSILASKLGANKVYSIDYDNWSCNNTSANSKLNNIDNLNIMNGSVELIDDIKFDVILANINRNILLDHLPVYAQNLLPNGLLLMSGFYIEDIPILKEAAEKHGLTFYGQHELNNWAMIILGNK